MDKPLTPHILLRKESLILVFLHFSSIDATKTERLGKYINDSTRFKNCKAAQFDYNGNPHLGIFATSDIKKGTELRYNYNGHGLFWRSNVSICF